MKHDYFEEQLKNILETGQEQPFKKAQWRRLHRRLREAEGRPLPWWQRWIPLGLVVLIGLLAWQTWREIQLTQELRGLQELIASRQPEPDGQQTLRTTVVYDTIYRKIVQEMSSTRPETAVSEIFSHRIEASGPAPEQVTNPLFYPGASIVTNELQPVDDYAAFASYLSEKRKKEKVQATAKSLFLADWETSELPPMLPVLLSVPAPCFSFNTAPAPAPEKFFRNPLWKRLVPKAYTLEAGIGSYPQWEAADEEALSLEVAVEASIGERVSFLVGGGYLQRFFNYDVTELPAGGFPAAPPVSPTDQRSGLNGNLNYLQVPIGLRWYALQGKALGVYLEGGFGTAIGAGDNITTVFTASDGSQYDVVNESPLPTSLRPNFYYGRVGLSYRFGEKVLGRVSLVQQQGMGQFAYTYQRPELLRWQVGFGLRL